jgi:2,4-dienoyl-CoA reductase-like NADH-dependent reductase (Old Yellow Enzyme family)
VPYLFDSLHLGDHVLHNRIIMAPLTRCRAGGFRVPNARMLNYYVQRASAGLILTEATFISPQGVGYTGTPGIWSVDRWRAGVWVWRIRLSSGRYRIRRWA